MGKAAWVLRILNFLNHLGHIFEVKNNRYFRILGHRMNRRRCLTSIKSK
jgi:hypothetical protein